MSAVLGVFGVDWRLLIVNLINFAILFGVLSYFLYRPITKMLATRREKVAQGIKDANEAAARLKSLEQEEKNRLALAAQEADKLVSSARASAAQKERDIVQKADIAAAALLKDAQQQAKELEREAILKSKEEVAKLIVLGIEKTAAHTS